MMRHQALSSIVALVAVVVVQLELSRDSPIVLCASATRFPLNGLHNYVLSSVSSAAVTSPIEQLQQRRIEANANQTPHLIHVPESEQESTHRIAPVWHTTQQFSPALERPFGLTNAEQARIWTRTHHASNGPNHARALELANAFATRDPIHHHPSSIIAPAFTVSDTRRDATLARLQPKQFTHALHRSLVPMFATKSLHTESLPHPAAAIRIDNEVDSSSSSSLTSGSSVNSGNSVVSDDSSVSSIDTPPAHSRIAQWRQSERAAAAALRRSALARPHSPRQAELRSIFEPSRTEPSRSDSSQSAPTRDNRVDPSTLNQNQRYEAHFSRPQVMSHPGLNFVPQSQSRTNTRANATPVPFAQHPLFTSTSSQRHISFAPGTHFDVADD